MTLVIEHDTELVATGTMDLTGDTWTCDIHSVEVKIGAGDCALCVAEISANDFVPDEWLVT